MTCLVVSSLMLIYLVVSDGDVSRGVCLMVICIVVSGVWLILICLVELFDGDVCDGVCLMVMCLMVSV